MKVISPLALLGLCLASGSVACGSVSSSAPPAVDAADVQSESDARRETDARSDASGAESDGGSDAKTCGEEPPLHCVCPNTQAECVGGSWQCPLTCPDGGASEGACPAGEVLVVSTSCATSATCTTGFQCGVGSEAVSGGPCCCKSSQCAILPAACDGTATCACASSLCEEGSSCGASLDSAPAGALSCGFFPP